MGRRGLFIAEGAVVLAHWLRNGGVPVSLLIAEKRVETLRPLLALLPPGVLVMAASQRVMDQIAGFPMHRGILALGRRPSPVDLRQALETLPPSALVVGLFGVANHDNMGGIFRNAAAFGADLVVLHPTCCDPLYRKSIRVSVGAALTTPVAKAVSEDDLLDALATSEFQLVALTPSAETPLNVVKPNGKTALLLGAEGEGLSESVMRACLRVRIPMASGVDSLNLAVSCGIALHHLRNRLWRVVEL